METIIGFMTAVFRRKENALVVFIAVISAFLFTSYNLNVSKKIGRLSSVCNYDDVVYLNKAAEIYFNAKENGIVSGAKLAVTHSLHAPFTVYNALLGFAAMGFNPENVYYAQIIVLLSYLFFVCWFTRDLKLYWRIAFLLSSLAIPYASLCVLVFRPDQMSGIMVGGLAMSVLTSENIFKGWLKGGLIGMGLGFALLIKSSTFALVILVIGGAWVLAAGRMLLLQKCSWGKVLLNFSLVLFAALLVAGWYWIQHWQELWAYFLENSFGVNSDVWRLPGGFWNHLLFYFRGDTSQGSMGSFMPFILTSFIGGCLYNIITRRNREMLIISLELIFMAACIFLIYFLQGIKNQYMGGVLYMYLFFGSLFFLSAGISSWKSASLLQSVLKYLAAIFLVVLALVFYRFPNIERVIPLHSQNAKITTLGIFQDIAKLSEPHIPWVLFTQGGPVIPESISMMMKSHGRDINIASFALKKDIKDIFNSINIFDYIIVQDKGIEGRPGFPMPAEIWEEDLKKYLDRQREWSLLSTYTTLDNKHVYLYRKTMLLNSRDANLPDHHEIH